MEIAVFTASELGVNDGSVQMKANIKFLRGIKRCTLHDLIQNENTT